MTRIVKIEKTGGPEVLKLETINLGKPSPDEVTIEHKAIGLNFIDTYHRSGLYPVELPSGIGAEGAGIIKEIGSKVKDFSVGDNVAYAGAPLGSYSTERNYPIKNLVKVPKEINLDIVATLMIKGLTTFYLLHKTYPVSSGETVLFHAAAGGVGQIFCQWAKSLDCKVIGTVGSDEKIDIAKKNGCDFVINYSKDNFAKKVLEITKGKGVPLDNIDVKKMIQPKGLYFTRPSMAQYLSTKEEIKEATDLLFEKVKLGKVKVNIFKKYQLEDVIQAHTDLENRKIIGPAILKPTK